MGKRYVPLLTDLADVLNEGQPDQNYLNQEASTRQTIRISDFSPFQQCIHIISAACNPSCHLSHGATRVRGRPQQSQEKNTSAFSQQRSVRALVHALGEPRSRVL